MSLKTAFLNLFKPEVGDKFSITGTEGYNKNMDLIDAAVKKNADDINQLNSDIKTSFANKYMACYRSTGDKKKYIAFEFVSGTNMNDVKYTPVLVFGDIFAYGSVAKGFQVPYGGITVAVNESERKLIFSVGDYANIGIIVGFTNAAIHVKSITQYS